MALYLGIDGGGSKTACVVGDESAELGRGLAGGSNVIRLGDARSREALLAAIQQACAEAKVPASDITSTCVGVAGAGREDIAERVRRLIADVVGGTIRVVGDMEITLQSAFGEGPGVIAIAGTGSIAYGRNAQGKMGRAGGWGFAISDEGSGHWIGQYAAAAAMRLRDEGQSGVLLDHVLKSFGIATADELVLVANATPPPDFATLLPAVLAAAEEGDRAAQSVLSQAGMELAELARIVMRQIFAENENIPVAMSGGVFRHSRRVRETFMGEVFGAHAEVRFVPEVVDPVKGALALARR